MIEIIKELPDNVVGIVARGRVTNEECDTVLRPAMEASLKRHNKIRLYYEVGSRFPGAGWADLDLAIDHLPDWHPSLSERVRQLHRSLQAAPDNTGEPAYDMRGLVYPFGEGGPKKPPHVKPIDLRADWATIYEQSIQQALVRL